MATQQEVIKKFMASLDKTTLSGTAALDEAIKACSNFNSMQEVIDKMISDCESVGNGKNFLLNYCGINLDNDDTGAITGFDAGGSAIKNAEDIVPETGELIKFTGNSFTVNGLTLQLEENFNDLTDSQKFMWQGLYTWWAKGALDLIAESYGNNFGFDSNSSATVNTMYVNFNEKSSTTLASMGYWYNLNLSINNSYYGYYLDTVDSNGVNTLPSGFYMPGITEIQYLDRTLAHEFTHAVMMTNIDNYSSLPQFIREGMPELTHGIDDERKKSILNLAGDSESLKSALNFEASQADEGSYSGGYMLLRYLAKQSTDEDNVIANINATVILNGTSLNDNIFNSGDNVTIYSGAGNDIVEIYGQYYCYIDLSAGDDYIYYKSNYVTIYGGAGNDTIRERQGYDNQVYAGDGNDLIINASGTIDGGKGNDTLTSVEGAIYGGEGNDLCISASGTINGGAGNDTIDGSSVTQIGRLYQYAAGDGADIIIGFNSFDTLEITSGTYSTQKSGDNLIVNVGNGSITLKNIYSNERNKVHIKDAEGNIVTLNDWSIMSGTNGADSLYNVVDSVTIDAMGGNDTIENHGAKVSISGGAGNDSINNYYSDNVTIDGNAGADYIYSEGEENIISGGAGNDTISGSGSTIYGGDGNDSIKSITGSYDTIDGGNGNDTIGSFDNSSMNGGAGNDVIELYTMWCNGTSTINGGTGNDTVNYSKFPSDELAAVYYGITGKNRYRAIYQYANGDGADVINRFTKYDKIEISGGSYSSVISGNDIILKISNGSITLKDAKDIDLNINGTFDSNTSWQTIHNSNSNTIVYGGDYDETITNTASNVTINAGGGNDSIDCANYSTSVLYNNSINAGNGNDTVHIYLTSLNVLDGGTGDDSIYAEINDDITLVGGAGNDTIIAEGDNRALIIGGDGDDKITVQGQGNQTINAGKGNDTISGSASSRLYQYSKDDGNDIIFGYGASDSIQIYGGTYKTKTSGNDVIIEVGNESVTVKDVGSMNLNIIGEQEEEKPIWKITGTTAIYGNDNDTLITISG